MKFDPERQFHRFRASGWTGADGRGWRIYDQLTGDMVAEFPAERGAYMAAHAEAARLNLEAYEARQQGDAA